MRMNHKVKKALIIGAVAGGIFGMLLTFSAANNVLNKKQTVMAQTETKLKKENQTLQSKVDQKDTLSEAATLAQQPADSWELVFVDNTHPLDQAYVPELGELIAERSLDTRILEESKLMLADAEAAGLKMNVLSAYRSYDDQRSVFNDTMSGWIGQGYTPIDAYDETKKSVAVPGYSEHALGLAMDIVSEEYQELDDKQGDTAESKWLAENAYKYGFILRYPAETEDKTSIVFEPWHYRYVGKEAAKEIWEKGITLEEYLGVIK